MSEGERVAAKLELAFCSSEDERFPAANLTQLSSGSSFPSAHRLAVWESEKFCEFPQELIFRVNRDLPTRIEQVNLLSHPFKVATRVEIFTSTATSDGIHDGKTGVRFDRLGFVCFLSNGNSHLAACELQEVQLPRQTSRVTLLRLVLHSCHQSRTNLFSQVGLASVVALGPKNARVVLPMISSPFKSASRNSLSPRHLARSPCDLITPSQQQTSGMKSPRATDIWAGATQNMKTPEQIIADIQIGRQLAQYANSDQIIQSWISLERHAAGAVHLQERYSHGTNTIDADHGLINFDELEYRRTRLENILSQKMFSSPRPGCKDQSQGPKTRDILNRLNASQFQEREQILWQLAENFSLSQDQRPPLAMSDKEALEIVSVALDDTNAGVFAAGCAFFRAVLDFLPYFQDATASKSNVAEFVDRLLEKLGSREASIRNVAAFTILKVAGSTRTRGTVVTHLLLQHVENKRFQSSAQQLLALLKLLAGLLLSFHCCANFDVAPRRILRFLLLSDAEQHENSLIREATYQVVLALSSDIEEEFILKHYVRKLAPELQERYRHFLTQNV